MDARDASKQAGLCDPTRTLYSTPRTAASCCRPRFILSLFLFFFFPFLRIQPRPSNALLGDCNSC